MELTTAIAVAGGCALAAGALIARHRLQGKGRWPRASSPGPPLRPPAPRVAPPAAGRALADGGRRVFVRETGAQEVLQTLRSLPPPERRRYAEDALLGRWVRWTGIVLEASEASRGPGGRPVVAMREARGEALVVYLALPERERATLRAGDQVTYEAEIAAVDGEVHLERGEVIRSRTAPP